MTPWAPIAITLAVVSVVALFTWRRTRDGSLAFAVVLCVLALASLALGTIATIAYYWAAFLFVMSALSFVASRLRSRAHRT